MCVYCGYIVCFFFDNNKLYKPMIIGLPTNSEGNMENKSIWRCNNCNLTYRDILKAHECCSGANKVNWNKKKVKK